MRMLAFAIISLASSTALAQSQPIVRAEVKPESVIVGESAELTVTVLVPTWFTRPPVYPTFELANAITRIPADSSYPLRERIGNDSWSGIVRTYDIYPLLGATYRMAGQTMNVTFANPGSDPISVRVEVPEVVLRSVVPEGAESLDPYLAGSGLDLGIDVQGNLGELKVGDAIVLTYRAELDGLPAIFLPPLAPDLEFEGVSVYRDTPDVQDGDTARRTEKVTLVFDAGGEFDIPGKALSFWNTASQSIDTATADGLLVAVQGPPAAAMTGTASSEEWRRQIVVKIIAVVVLALLLWRGFPVLVRRYREAARRRRQTEGYAFRQLLAALASDDDAAAYRALLRWVERLEPGLGGRDFAARYGDTVLAEAVASLSAGIYSAADTRRELGRIRGQLKAARRRYLHKGSSAGPLQLPPLNP